eukprot:TRINITY_DN52130_c0_g1_i1.p1 TRINITY_DN52130_c0_g1~~TRINITY_DN52130_c0_g1_i1.p1  ORF type:complete len:387 (+),score=69.83 TRINITY_DN52130_c0_g1_i1:51-1163(+)
MGAEEVRLVPLPDKASLDLRRCSGTLGKDDLQLLIGRHPECHLQVDDVCVSVHHARLLRKDGGLEMEVLGSNGMLVAGRWRARGEVVQVQEGDRLAIGCFMKSRSRQRRPLLAWQLHVGDDDCAADILQANELRPQAWLVPLCSRSTVHLPSCDESSSLCFGPSPDFECREASASRDNDFARLVPVGATFQLQQLGEAGCFLNELWLGPGMAQSLRHGDVITFCQVAGKFLPQTRGMFVFGVREPSEVAERRPRSEVPSPCRAAQDTTTVREAGPDSLTMTVIETVLGPDPSLMSQTGPRQEVEEVDMSKTLPLPGAWWVPAMEAVPDSKDSSHRKHTLSFGPGCKPQELSDRFERPALRRRMEQYLIEA